MEVQVKGASSEYAKRPGDAGFITFTLTFDEFLTDFRVRCWRRNKLSRLMRYLNK